MAEIPLSLSGIYCIHNVISGRRYVGSSISIRKRWRAHRGALVAGNHIAKAMQRSWAKYGSDAFEFSVLEAVPDHGALIAREQFWIDHFNAACPKRGFNSSPTAGNCLGLKASDETKALMSAQRRGVTKSAAHRKAIGDAQKGKVIPPEQRALLAEGTRRHFSENPEARERMREVGRRNGALSKGRKMDEAVRLAMALQRKSDPKYAEIARQNAKNVNPENLKLGAIARGIRRRGEPNSKIRALTFKQAEEIRQLKADGWTYDRLVERFGIDRCSLWNIVNRRTYQRP